MNIFQVEERPSMQFLLRFLNVSTSTYGSVSILSYMSHFFHKVSSRTKTLPQGGSNVRTRVLVAKS